MRTNKAISKEIASSSNAHPLVSCAFGDGEQHRVVVRRGGDRCIFGPTVSQIKDYSCPSLIDNGVSHKPVRVVGGGVQLDVRPQYVVAPPVIIPLVKA
ncbi:hypothetical protein TIFTF001_015164 [Ficus carica]|uniref:Uncharacterized protein n=1 Tax=Ficus carica TaxID=3494 RepID=A0AA88A0S1_FICCA|nr:hypothetical protein TIFTF001_015164 [Ficus carica]